MHLTESISDKKKVEYSGISIILKATFSVNLQIIERCQSILKNKFLKSFMKVNDDTIDCTGN